ncbi:MAG TPA: hypothetical protein VMV27_13405 [Candidatus Binataceae bacterium]|nr:hypothetical protein [Candidatus Binataceae bacterium]
MHPRVPKSRILALALALAFSLPTLSGCALGLSTIAPAAMSFGEYAGIEAAKGPDRNTAGPEDEQSERCDTLVQTPPGVEEVRKNADDEIESRQWRLIDSGDGMKWAIVQPKMAPPGGWQPKPGIAKLQFSPELASQLKRGGDPRYLAYAPEDTETIADSDQETTVTEVFGPATGKFLWHGRTYGYVLVKKLPCFKSLN